MIIYTVSASWIHLLSECWDVEERMECHLEVHFPFRRQFRTPEARSCLKACWCSGSQ